MSLRSAIPLASAWLLVAFGIPAAAQQEAFPLRSVDFEGSSHFGPEELLEASGLEIGRPVTKRDFDAALRRLNESGMFEGMSYRFAPQGDGYRLTVVLQELSELFRVRFEGFADADDAPGEVLGDRLPLYAGVVPAGGPMVRMAVSVLQAWWSERGQSEEILADLVPGEDGTLLMVIGPRRETTNIAFTRFRNTGEVDARELQRVFNQAAVGERYSEARLGELLHYNARPLFTERGYLNVRFCPCEAQPDPDSLGVLVDVQVEAGEVYTFGEIAWPEPLPIAPETLRKVSSIGPGQIANLKAAYETMAKISEGAKRQGYMKAQSTFTERIDHSRRMVDLDVEISLGLQYEFSRLIVEGLDILSEPVVRKRWGMQSGDPFDVRYPAYFLDRIKADAMFENLKRTSWSLSADDATGRVDVTLLFSGKIEE